MYADGWRKRLREELDRKKLSLKDASQAARMHDGWVSELLNPAKAKEPTISAFARMCIETGMRMSYILTGEGGSAEEEQFSALFQALDHDVKLGLLAMMREMRKSPSLSEDMPASLQSPTAGTQRQLRRRSPTS